MFRARNGMLPDHLQRMFKLTPDEEEQRRRGNFYQPFARTTLRQMYTAIVGVKMWNSLTKEMEKLGEIREHILQSVNNVYECMYEPEIDR